ncbi:MAG: cobyrinate a,c-diamide synthase [Myxococcota bacterium]
MIPTLVVAAPASGEGKTTVVCAIAAALRTRGLDVRLFKAGPDYLDPSWHRLVSGRPSRNLDGWMTGREGVAASFARGAKGGDIALIEGVMGLFDGRSPTSLEGSAAELATWLGAPVLAVVDASGMARTAAAVVHGLATYRPEVRVAGVVFNRAPHGKLLREAMAAPPLERCPMLGALPVRDDLAVPERHLGLVSAEVAGRPTWVTELAAWAGEHLDLDGIIALAAPVSVGEVPAAGETRARIGIARDAAFHFYYDDNLDLLREAGAELVAFSPLADATLPDVDGLYIGGGYPEAHREALSANVAMRAAIRAFAGPIYAECGGLMYLGEALDDAPMCRVLPVRTRMTGKLRTLGYREVTTTADTPLGPAGTTFRGHEFHYSELADTPDVSPVYRMVGRFGAGVEGWARGRVLGSYVHAHFGSNPSLATNLVDACRAR